MGRGHLAEVPGECDLLCVADLLVAEEDHLVGVQGVTDLLHDAGLQLAAQVDTAHLGSDVAGHGHDVQTRIGERS
ncbi:hypothetical protein BHQ19_06885 [Mycolicibacterium porcinum]|nr:hypothetical protein BHQ19_06885 [Mycolicibacterium porcinum]